MQALTTTRRFAEQAHYLELELRRGELLASNIERELRLFERDAARYSGHKDLAPYRERMMAVKAAFDRGEGHFLAR